MNHDNFPQVIKDVGFDFDWDEGRVWKLDVPVEDMDTSELLWHFDVPFLDKEGTEGYNLTPWQVINKGEGTGLHSKRMKEADLSYPLDIMENKGRWTLLDGLHRLMKAYTYGYRAVKVRKIPRDKISEVKK